MDFSPNYVAQLDGEDRVGVTVMKRKMAFPSSIEDEASLLELMTRPSEAVVELVSRIEGPLVVVGAGGKMGPSLCWLAKRAAEVAGNDLEIIALSRFSNATERDWLESKGIRTCRFDALNADDGAALPDASHVVYLVGLKFGTGSNPELTWATNTLAPAAIARRYANVPVVALSTGNVYPMVPSESRGSSEQDALTPLGEYANAAVARERIFGHFCKSLNLRCALLRLNYALDLRYGILVDLGQSILAGNPIDISTSRVNCIWQGDANDRILRSFDLVASPVAAFNLTSIESYAIKDLAQALGERLGVSPTFCGKPAPNILLSDSTALAERLGLPEMRIETVLDWTADWLKNGKRTLGRPTKFQVSDGRF